MLCIIATPIGNLQDITLRAVECLKTCDYILCEDTRHSAKLLHAYEIKTPLVSFHLFNETAREEKIILDLQDGKNIALISDAGTPLISDPGFSLIQKCREQNIAVTSLPGPCALITALTLSGLSSLPFQFVGFLPKKEGELTSLLENICDYPGTTICYESPNRVHKTIKTLATIDPDRKVVIARELTKKYESVIAGTAGSLQLEDIQGEVVLLIEGAQKEVQVTFSQEVLHLLVHDLVKQGLSVKDAVSAISAQLHVPRKIVFKSAH